ncbi:MAG: DNA internalization-related competence protein ComEC/Rec2 [Candidatus Aminicenantes bacterium]|nr:DNA internalization-related competence protein ComEC/Rec2 [Candidatus Aminicenantes bacterium]
MTYPFVYLALALASGITLSAQTSFGIPVALALLCTQLAISWLLFLLGKTKAAFFTTLLTVFFLGYAFHSHNDGAYAANGLRRLRNDAYIDFIGTVYRSPGRGLDKDYLFLKVREVHIHKEMRKIRGRLRISIPHSKQFPRSPAWSVGDRIKVSAKLNPSHGFHNFYPSTIETYYQSQGIHNLASTKSPLLVEHLKAANPLSPLHIISLIRQALQNKIEAYFTATEGQLSSQGAILEALMLGERGRIPASVTLSLQKAGIYHLFAISGAHIAIISFLFFSVFRLLGISQRRSFYLLIAFLLFYALLVEGRPSVLRATIMAIFFLVGKLLWKDVNLLNTLSFSAFFLLIINPFHLFAPGFQLTFAATLAIILFYPRIITRVPRLPFKISEIFTLSLAAQIGVLPIVISAFNRVTFSAFLLNYAAIPLVALIMALGLIFLPLSFLSGFLAAPIASLLGSLVDLLCITSGILDPVSFLSYRIPTPSSVVLVGYFFFLVFFLVPLRRKGPKIAVFFGFLVFFFLLITYPFPAHSKNLKITFIDVGQGDSILIEFPGRKKMLIDGGGTREGTFDIGENVVCPFLWKKGIKKIDYMVLSHAHPDHMNGLKAVARNFRVTNFWECFSPLNNESYNRFLESFSPRVVKRRMFRGEDVSEGSVQIHVVHPPKAHPVTASVHNNQSMVLRITYGRQTLLLTGDIEKEIERKILESSLNIASTVLKSPHHGSQSSSSIEFLEKIAPEIVVISAGKGNRYGLPHPDVLTRYERIGAKVYRTEIHGAIEIVSNGLGIAVRTALTPHPESCDSNGL